MERGGTERAEGGWSGFERGDGDRGGKGVLCAPARPLCSPLACLALLLPPVLRPHTHTHTRQSHAVCIFFFNHPCPGADDPSPSSSPAPPPTAPARTGCPRPGACPPRPTPACAGGRPGESRRRRRPEQKRKETQKKTDEGKMMRRAKRTDPVFFFSLSLSLSLSLLVRLPHLPEPGHPLVRPHQAGVHALIIQDGQGLRGAAPPHLVRVRERGLGQQPAHPRRPQRAPHARRLLLRQVPVADFQGVNVGDAARPGRQPGRGQRAGEGGQGRAGGGPGGGRCGFR